jgi:hypothetical protein
VTDPRGRATEVRIGDYRLESLAATEHWDIGIGVHVVLPRRATLRIAIPGVVESGLDLLREAWIVEALAHPGVPRVYDCGRLPDGRAWVAIECLRDDTLAERLTTGPLPPTAVAAMVRDVAAVLEHAHMSGIANGAIHAGAIFLTDGRRGWPVVVADWSTARAPDDEAAGAADVDVYDLGAAAFHALTGAALDEPATAVAERILRAVAHRTVVTAATSHLARLVESMVALDPDHRPTSGDVRDTAGALASAIERELAESADLAIAMLAVDEISDEHEVADLAEVAGPAIEMEALLPDPDDPVTDEITLADALDMHDETLAKLRKVKWTPPYGGAPLAGGAAVAGEIDTSKKPSGDE